MSRNCQAGFPLINPINVHDRGETASMLRLIQYCQHEKKKRVSGKKCNSDFFRLSTTASSGQTIHIFFTSLYKILKQYFRLLDLEAKFEKG